MKNWFLIALLFIIGACQKKGVAEYDQDDSIEYENSIQEILSTPQGFKGLDSLIDWNYVYQNVKIATDLDEDKITERAFLFQKGVSAYLSSTSLDSIDNILYRTAGAYSKDGNYHLLIEVASVEGIDFFDFELDTVRNVVKDMFFYGTGQSLVDILMNQLTIESNGLHKHMKLYKSAMELYNLNEYEGAWEYIDMMPYELRYRFPMQKLVYLLSENHEELILDLIDEYQEEGFSPDYVAFITLKAGVTHNRYKEIIDGVNHLKKKLPASLILKSYEGYAYELQEDYEEAERHYNQVLQLSSDHIIGYLNKIELYFLLDDDVKAVELMKECDRKFKTTLEDWKEFLSEEIIIPQQYASKVL